MLSSKGMRRTLAGVMLLFLMVSVVNAYTVVLKDRRRVQVPDNSNPFGVGTIFALPFDTYDTSYERSQLI